MAAMGQDGHRGRSVQVQMSRWAAACSTANGKRSTAALTTLTVFHLSAAPLLGE